MPNNFSPTSAAAQAAKQVAKSSFEVTKTFAGDVNKQVLGNESLSYGTDAQAANSGQEDIAGAKMKDEQYRTRRYQELKQELDTALLQAQQQRLQKEKEWQESQVNVMQETSQQEGMTEIEGGAGKQKKEGPFAGMKKAVKSMYNKVTSKERRSGPSG